MEEWSFIVMELLRYISNLSIDDYKKKPIQISGRSYHGDTLIDDVIVGRDCFINIGLL